MRFLASLLTLTSFPLTSFGAIVLDNTSELSGGTVTLSPTLWAATPVLTDGSGYADSIVTVDLSDVTSAGTLFVEIRSSSSFMPGLIIEDLAPLGGSATQKVFASSSSLSANTPYFLVVGVRNGGSNAFAPVNGTGNFTVNSGSWLLNTGNVGAPHLTYSSTNLGATWQSDSGASAPLRFSIDAVQIPEPSTILLSGLAILGLSARRRS